MYVLLLDMLLKTADYEVFEPTRDPEVMLFPFSLLSPSLCVFKLVYLCEPTCAQLTTRAPELNLNKVTP